MNTTNTPNKSRPISPLLLSWAVATAVTCLFATPVMAVDGTWNATTTPASWGVAGNWSGSAVPGGAESTVSIVTGGAPFSRTITMDGDRTVGIMNMSGGAHYTITSGTGGTMFFDNGESNAQLNFAVTFDRTISAPIVLNSSLDIDSSGGTARDRSLTGTITAGGGDTAKVITNNANVGGAPLKLNGTISDGAGARVVSIHQNTAAGSLSLGGANTFSGGVRVSAGTLILPSGSSPNSEDALGTGTLTLDGGNLSFFGFSIPNYGNATEISADTNINLLSAASSAKTKTLGTLSVGNQVVTVQNTDSATPNAGKDTLVFGATTLTGNASFDVNNTGSVPTLLRLGALNGSSNLTKTGTGEMELNTAAGSYSGTTFANGGLLTVGNNTAMGGGVVVIGGSAASTLSIGSAFTVGNDITYSNTNAGSALVRVSSGSATFNAGTTGIFGSDLGGVDTAAAFRAASVPGTATLMMAFASTSAASNDGTRISDVFNLSLDITTDRTFVLQLDTAGSDPGAYLAWLDSGAWTLATDGNTGSGGLAGAYTTTWDAFLTNNGGTFNASTMLGAYGYDTASGQGWAVLNHASDYALVVPEPSTVVLCGLGLGFMLFRLRTTRRQLS